MANSQFKGEERYGFSVNNLPSDYFSVTTGEDNKESSSQSSSHSDVITLNDSDLNIVMLNGRAAPACDLFVFKPVAVTDEGGCTGTQNHMEQHRICAKHMNTYNPSALKFKEEMAKLGVVSHDNYLATGKFLFCLVPDSKVVYEVVVSGENGLDEFVNKKAIVSLDSKYNNAMNVIYNTPAPTPIVFSTMSGVWSKFLTLSRPDFNTKYIEASFYNK